MSEMNQTPAHPASDAIAQALDAWFEQPGFKETPDPEHVRRMGLAIAAYESAREIAPQPGEGGSGVTDEMVERACKRYAFREDGAVWPDAYSEHEVAAERVLMRELLEHARLTSPPHAADALDGERYRRLRDAMLGEDEDFMRALNAANRNPETPEEYDATIDAAIAARAEAGDSNEG